MLKFNEEEVYLIGAALALIVSVLIFIPIGKANLKWYWSHSQTNSLKDKTVSLIFGVVMGGALYYAVCKFFHYTSVIWLITIGTGMEGFILGLYYFHINKRFSEKSHLPKVHDEQGLRSNIRLNIAVYYQILAIVLINMVLGMGLIAGTRWTMPDIVEIHDGPKRSTYEYKVSNYYVMPFVKGLTPGKSYIDNQSKDTIYRVIVNYAYLGEEKCNLYAVTDKYAPSSFSPMPSHTFHVMDTIAPVMPSSSGKMGRYHTQRIYLTDNEHLWDFRLVEMRGFGLNKNRQVDSIPESGNMPDRENNEEYRAYKRISPFPYSRLRPITVFRKSQ